MRDVMSFDSSNLNINSVKSITIDIIRIASAQLVLIGHLLNYLYGYNESPAALLGDAKLFIQNLGVVTFFILSGYLIGVSLLHKQKVDPCYSFKEFFVDRFSRIYMTLIPCMIVILLCDLYNISNNKDYYFPSEFTAKEFFGNLLMLQDYVVNVGFNFYRIDLGIDTFASGRVLWTLIC